MRQNLEYTIVSGWLSNDHESTQISFALVSEEDGLFRVEAFLEDTGFFERNQDRAPYDFRLHGVTEKGYEIEATELYMARYTYANGKFELICHGHLKLTKPEQDQPQTAPRTRSYRPRIWFIEVEGLRIKHADHTRLHKERYFTDRNDIPEFKFDHTRCHVVLNDLPNNGNSFTFTIYGGEDGTNAIIDFSYDKGYSKLHWDEYQAIKANLIHFLSLINGARLMIRREYTGLSYRPSEKKRWSQVEYLHSFKRLVNSGSSDFLPIHNHHSYTNPVFMMFGLLCFDTYCKLQDKLALNEVIDALHESFATSGIEERFYILVTIFEKLSSKLAAQTAQTTPLMPSDLFDEVQKKILQVATEYKAAINRTHQACFDTLVSRIGNLNKVKRSSQDDMHALLSHARIPISRAVRSFLDTERHESVHRGIVGRNDNERYLNYLKLDNMIRDIILNMIGYEGPRIRRIAYFSDAERLHKEGNHR